MRLAGTIAVVLTLVCGVVAALVHACLAGAARGWLEFPFTGIPSTPAETIRIFLHNLRALAAICGALLIVYSMRYGSATATKGRGRWLMRAVCDVAVTAAVVSNVLVVGAAFGAYGGRMLTAALPQGPVELGAYSLALAVYVEARERRVPLRHVARMLALSGLALAFAAVLEAYVNV